MEKLPGTLAGGWDSGRPWASSHFLSMKTWLEQGVPVFEAVAVRPLSVQTRLLPSKTTLKAAFGQSGVRPGLNVVGWPRSAGAGVDMVPEPIGMGTELELGVR